MADPNWKAKLIAAGWVKDGHGPGTFAAPPGVRVDDLRTDQEPDWEALKQQAQGTPATRIPGHTLTVEQYAAIGRAMRDQDVARTDAVTPDSFAAAKARFAARVAEAPKSRISR
jgi:hypothetical protein